jgi:hypothetical protein
LFQNILNKFGEYCNTWRLKANTDKTKVIVFSRGRQSTNLKFTLNGGFTILLKSSSWHSIDKLSVLPLFKTSNIAFVAFSACFLIVLLKFPVYCNTWRLKANTDKTKVIFFPGGDNQPI